MFELIEMVLENLLLFQIVSSIIKVTIGVGLCFGALKWRRGLLTSTAIGWGFVLGVLCAMALSPSGDGTLLFILIGVIALPILTYSIPGVNRFMLGFLVSSKLLFMLTTVLAKEGGMDVGEAIVLPLVGGTVAGVALMAWTSMRVSAFVLGCTFIGASEIAPVISEWINRILFSVTGNITYLFDPVDMIFALFKIELTDIWVLLSMIILMIWGARKQIRALKEEGIPLDTPIIGFECLRADNGKIDMGDRTVNTMK